MDKPCRCVPYGHIHVRDMGQEIAQVASVTSGIPTIVAAEPVKPEPSRKAVVVETPPAE